MKALITGSSSGIGYGIALRFLSLGYDVVGIDINDCDIDNPKYTHYICDIKDKNNLPNVTDIDILINNAGTQNSEDDIANNLKGTINVTEKYIETNNLKSILFNASASALSGFEFPEYVASKAGMIGYMKNVACRLAEKGCTVNSLSLGGVYTHLNDPVINNERLWKKIMDVTPMKKWMTVDEVCDFAVFLTVTNKSMSGQNLLVDNGELNLNSTFVWPYGE